MENVDLAQKLYGENSIFCLSYYMSGMSANVQKGTHNVAENILNKMLRVLEHENELKNGNQYFFLASILLGVVCYSAQKYDQAHLFFTGTMKKQLVYVEEEKDHPFLEQTYMHMAVMYKTINNLNTSAVMWKNLLNCHKRAYGDNSHVLAPDYKNIGTCELGINKVTEAIESLNLAEKYGKLGIEQAEDDTEKREEKKQLAEIYFAQYLAHVANNDWDKALVANDNSMKLNVENLGPNDLNVANNYYLAAQIHLKKLGVEEALKSVNKANEIIDTKPSKEPLLLCRYRFLRAKLNKMKEKNTEALKDLDEAIKVAEGNSQLYKDEVEIKNFRKNLINCLSDEEKSALGIDPEEEKLQEEKDKNKRKQLENEMRKSYMEKQLKAQGIDPSQHNMDQFTQQEEEEEEGSFLDTPLGALTAVGGLLAVGLGAMYFFKKSN